MRNHLMHPLGRALRHLVTLSPCLLLLTLALPALGQSAPAVAPTTITAGPIQSTTVPAANAPLTAPATKISSTKPFEAMTAPAPKPVKKSPAPTTAVDQKTCATADCHPEVKDYKVVHGPVNVNACDACHKLTDPAKHTYEAARPKEQVCTFCHKMDVTAPPGGTLHQPMKTGDCLPCHNPHGGKTAKFIRSDNMLQVCNQCHKDVVGMKKNIHGPVAAGACEACHSPHASKYPKLLREEGKTLCLTCHKEMGDQLKSAKVAHKPVMEGECTACHDSHASDYKMQIKADPLTLCTSCHEHDKIKQAATDATHKHSIVLQDQACMNCHTPHGGPLAKLLKARPVDICIKCHKSEQKAPDGHIVKSVAEVTDATMTRHGPVKDGLCSGCHNPHGSDVQKLLAKPYPDTFYAKFDPDNFALCFTCHDKKLVEAKEAEGLTGFRNGTQNLHFVHVNKEKGRTCRACHETHASPSPVMLRTSVPYGQWELPVNFNKTETGGSCSPGCHKEYSYDRKNPANNSPATAPATPTPGGTVTPTPAVPTPPSAVVPGTTVTTTPGAPATPTPPAATTPATLPTTAPTRNTPTPTQPGRLNLPQ